MNKVIKLTGIGLLAFAMAGVQLQLNAQETGDGSTANKAAVAKQKTLPFNGTLKSVDKEAGTVEVGNRTFRLTADSKYLQGSLDEARVGEKVGGSYRKGEDGSLIVNSIRIGAKPKKDKKETASGQ